MSVTFASDTNAPTVNLSNGNALTALGHMGLGLDHEGDFPAGEFYIGAMALLLLDDTGIPSQTDTGAGGCVFTECGLRPGYWLDLANRFLALSEGATEVWWS